VAYRALGVRFDSSSLGWLWQFVEPTLLRTDFLRSVFYLHTQPPLFNALLGVVLKVFPGQERTAFGVIYFVLGLLLTVNLYKVGLLLRIGRRSSAIIALIFMASPAAVLHENWLFYSYPLAVMLSAAPNLLQRFLTRFRFRDGVSFFGLIAAACLTTAFFHLTWLLAHACLVLFIAPRSKRRRVLGAAAIPLAFVAMLYAKNWVIFGEPTASTWFGMNLARTTLMTVPLEEREALIARAAISELARTPPFSPLAAYPTQWTDLPARGVPVLDEVNKLSGAPNYNHAAFLRVSHQYRDAALRAMALRPECYLQSVGNSLIAYLLPTTDNRFLTKNKKRILPVVQAFDVAMYGAPGAILIPRLNADSTSIARDVAMRASIGWMCLMLLVIAAGWRRGVGAWKERLDDPAMAGVILFIALNCVYVTLVGVLLDFGENNRFRFPIDPMIWVAGLALLGRALQPVFTRLRAHCNHREHE